MGTIYDSGWVPAASGTINANVHTDSISSARVICAASGAASASVPVVGFTAGGAYVARARLGTDYLSTPLITGTIISMSAPGVNATSSIYLGVNISGTVNASPWVPNTLSVTMIAGAASWARVIVEGK